jgi:hypothetical protein
MVHALPVVLDAALPFARSPDTFLLTFTADSKQHPSPLRMPYAKYLFYLFISRNNLLIVNSRVQNNERVKNVPRVRRRAENCL